MHWLKKARVARTQKPRLRNLRAKTLLTAQGETLIGLISDADEKGAQILVLGQREIDALVTLGETMAKAGLPVTDLRGLIETPSKRTAKGKKGQTNEGVPLVPQSVQDALAGFDAMAAHSGLDWAMFGRMTTGVALSRVDSAVHVGHALTVHGIQSTVDFWSAQDELRTDDAGAAHINTRELTTGVYYMPIAHEPVDSRRKRHSGRGAVVDRGHLHRHARRDARLDRALPRSRRGHGRGLVPPAGDNDGSVRASGAADARRGGDGAQCPRSAGLGNGREAKLHFHTLIVHRRGGRDTRRDALCRGCR
jgi:CT1975-like protein